MKRPALSPLPDVRRSARSKGAIPNGTTRFIQARRGTGPYCSEVYVDTGEFDMGWLYTVRYSSDGTSARGTYRGTELSEVFEPEAARVALDGTRQMEGLPYNTLTSKAHIKAGKLVDADDKQRQAKALEVLEAVHEARDPWEMRVVPGADGAPNVQLRPAVGNTLGGDAIPEKIRMNAAHVNSLRHPWDVSMVDAKGNAVPRETKTMLRDTPNVVWWVCEKDWEPYAFHAPGRLAPTLVERLRAAFVFIVFGAWLKCCGASIRATLSSIRFLLTDEGKKSFFGSSCWQNVVVLGCALDPRKFSSRIRYVHRQADGTTGEPLAFQFGGTLRRQMYTAPLTSDQQTATAGVWGAYMGVTKGFLADLKPWNCAAKNSIDRTDLAPGHGTHRDVKQGHAQWACIVPSPVEAGKDHGGGELLILRAAMKFPSRAGDLNGLAGEYVHAVGPVKQTAASGPHPQRNSMVFFHKDFKATESRKKKPGPLLG